MTKETGSNKIFKLIKIVSLHQSVGVFDKVTIVKSQDFEANR